MNRIYKLIIIIGLTALLATPALADEGEITFNGDGTCVEADGTLGLSTFDDLCITAADYDLIFGYENLSTIPSHVFPTRSVAEVYNIDSDVPASLRLLGIGVVDEPFTYWETVNGLVML